MLDKSPSACSRTMMRRIFPSILIDTQLSYKVGDANTADADALGAAALEKNAVHQNLSALAVSAAAR